jgi:hypothetical protein
MAEPEHTNDPQNPDTHQPENTSDTPDPIRIPTYQARMANAEQAYTYTGQHILPTNGPQHTRDTLTSRHENTPERTDNIREP